MTYRILTYIVKPSHQWYKEIDFLSYLSKNLYNSTLYYERQAYFNTKRFRFYNDLNREFTHSNQVDYRALPAKVSQQTQRALNQAITTYLKFKRILTGINKRDYLIIYIKQKVVFLYFMIKVCCPLRNKVSLSYIKHQ